MSDICTQSIGEQPLRAEITRVVLLPRDPYCLYACWELSIDTKDAFIREFGERLWDKSPLVLKVTDVSKSESFIVSVNDYISDWYIKVPDSNSLYVAELGKKISEQFFISFACSNYISTPENGESNNTNAFFTDYRSLKGEGLDFSPYEFMDSSSYYSNTTFSPDSPDTSQKIALKFGISSTELFRIG